MQTLETGVSDAGERSHNEVLFTLRKNEWRAICEAVCRCPQEDAVWELRLYVGAPDNQIVSGSCESLRAAVELADKWKGKMVAKGWG